MTRHDVGERRALEHVAYCRFDPAPKLLQTAVMALWTDFLVVRLEAEHRGDRPFEHLDDIRQEDRGRVARELGAAAHPTMRNDDAAFVESGELMLEEPRWDVLALGDLSRRNRPVTPAAGELHQGPKAVLGAEREFEHREIAVPVRLESRVRRLRDRINASGRGLVSAAATTAAVVHEREIDDQIDQTT